MKYSLIRQNSYSREVSVYTPTGWNECNNVIDAVNGQWFFPDLSMVQILADCILDDVYNARVYQYIITPLLDDKEGELIAGKAKGGHSPKVQS
jgi:hypothetical protein